MITQDRDAALAAFAESGYTLDGDRLVGPDGAQLEFALTTANGYSTGRVPRRPCSASSPTSA